MRANKLITKQLTLTESQWDRLIDHIARGVFYRYVHPKTYISVKDASIISETVNPAEDTWLKEAREYGQE